MQHQAGFYDKKESEFSGRTTGFTGTSEINCISPGPSITAEKLLCIWDCSLFYGLNILFPMIVQTKQPEMVVC